MRHFANDEAGYLAGLDRNPTGFVLNTRADVDLSYLVLHRAVCSAIRPGRNYVEGAFTERAYSKLVAADESELRTLFAKIGACSVSKRCSRCLS